MTKAQRAKATRRSKVRQMKLPTENIDPPSNNNWSAREARARREMERARKAAGL